MLMPDPASGLQDIERLLDVPCPEWSADLACRGVELDCAGIEHAQAALRDALAKGGTHHDVLARVGRALGAARLSAKRRLIALAVVDVARTASRRRLALAFAHAAAGSPVRA
jgi:hypothetical protein